MKFTNCFILITEHKTCMVVFIEWRDLSETCQKYLPCELALLKFFSRLEVRGHGHLYECVNRDGPKVCFGFIYGAETGDIFSFGYGRDREALFRPTFGYG